MLKLSTLSALISLAFCSVAVADDVCSSVLKERAFDVFDSSTQSHIAQTAKNDICDVKWSSRDDFQSRTRKWDSSFNMIDFFSGTGNADLSGADHTIAQDYHLLCESGDNSYLVDYLATRHVQIASVAVAAWESCIKTTADQIGLWSCL